MAWKSAWLGREVLESSATTLIYKELLQTEKKKTNKPIEKWARNTSRQMTQEQNQMARKFVKRCTPLIFREVLLK